VQGARQCHYSQYQLKQTKRNGLPTVKENTNPGGEVYAAIDEFNLGICKALAESEAELRLIFEELRIAKSVSGPGGDWGGITPSNDLNERQHFTVHPHSLHSVSP
jgi:hypothetical protein